MAGGDHGGDRTTAVTPGRTSPARGSSAVRRGDGAWGRRALPCSALRPGPAILARGGRAGQPGLCCASPSGHLLLTRRGRARLEPGSAWRPGARGRPACTCTRRPPSSPGAPHTHPATPRPQPLPHAGGGGTLGPEGRTPSSHHHSSVITDNSSHGACPPPRVASASGGTRTDSTSSPAISPLLSCGRNIKFTTLTLFRSTVHGRKDGAVQPPPPPSPRADSAAADAPESRPLLPVPAAAEDPRVAPAGLVLRGRVPQARPRRRRARVPSSRRPSRLPPRGRTAMAHKTFKFS